MACTKLNRKTLKKSRNEFTAPAMTKALMLTFAFSVSPSIVPPIALLVKCGAAREKGNRRNREKSPANKKFASGLARDNKRPKLGSLGLG